ncbi:MAG: hypothetical protein B6230_01480 [Desulfobacteraceae bacterium 4572_89]|nr:MAG: hypothetical protein B6230_01480 [Desulfobacteraceae bacterium 4572_89]
MSFSKEFLNIAKISGVDRYIFLDDQGNIAAHDIKNPQKASEMFFSCNQNIRAISSNKFKYAIFSRKNKKNILIFPVGNYSLGVIKQEGMDTLVLVDSISKFLNELMHK